MKGTPSLRLRLGFLEARKRPVFIPIPTLFYSHLIPISSPAFEPVKLQAKASVHEASIPVSISLAAIIAAARAEASTILGAAAGARCSVTSTAAEAAGVSAATFRPMIRS
jgi:hypothetical protein